LAGIASLETAPKAKRLEKELKHNGGKTRNSRKEEESGIR